MVCFLLIQLTGNILGTLANILGSFQRSDNLMGTLAKNAQNIFVQLMGIHTILLTTQKQSQVHLKTSSLSLTHRHHRREMWINRKAVSRNYSETTKARIDSNEWHNQLSQMRLRVLKHCFNNWSRESVLSNRRIN